MISKGYSLTFPVLLGLFAASQTLRQPLQQVLYGFVFIQGSKTVTQRIFDILHQSNLMEVKESPVSFKTISVSNLIKKFGEKIVFDNINFDLMKNEKMLIKGPSGSGKSTLLKMMTGEIPLDCGKVCLKYGNKEFKLSVNEFGVISQEPFIFNGSVRFNLSLHQKFNDKSLLEVLAEVGLENDLVLDDELVNNGENISGGQKIRIELARFLLRKKEILFVDELTAALDNENAKKVRDLIFSLPLTVIEIAHHIDNIEHYDKILTLKGGDKQW